MNSETSFQFDDILRSAIELVGMTGTGTFPKSRSASESSAPRCSTTAMMHYSVSSGFAHHPDKSTESMSSSFRSSTGRRLAGRPVEI